MQRWRDFVGCVSDIPCAEGWKAVVAINHEGKNVGTYSAPESEFDEAIVERMEAKLQAARQLRLMG